MASVIFALVAVIGPAWTRDIVSWGPNSMEAIRALGVTALREGCSSAPAICVEEAERDARAEGLNRIYLSVPLAQATGANALEYRRLSASHPALYEIGVDDFIAQYSRFEIFTRFIWPRADSVFAGQFLRTLRASSLKSGITIYETELRSPVLLSSPVSERLRSMVDNVHFYLNYRGSGGRYLSYVKQVRDLFPTANLIAGSYAYDRIDYLPCFPGSQAKCSSAEQSNLFRESIDTQVTLLAFHEINGIEFYPGLFGREETWNGWKQPRICDSERTAECIVNTRALQQIAIEALRKRPMSQESH
jgi:hypothetical protein